jgi:hypothetical protein
VPDAERERPLWQLEQYVSIVFDVVLSAGTDCARGVLRRHPRG